MRRKAFTLIELLVVVGIIAVLIAIIVPTLGAVRTRAYKVKTQALMNQLQGAIASYYAHFRAYPGPLGTSTVGSQSVYVPAPAATPDKVSGAQNLVLGLSFAT